MPDQPDNTGGGNNRNKQKGNSQPAFKIVVEGSLNSCDITVKSKPSTRVGFYAGKIGGNQFGKRVVNNDGSDFLVDINQFGIGKLDNVDLSSLTCLDKLDSLTAVSPDGRQTEAVRLPSKAATQLQGKFLKIISPAEELFVKRDQSLFPIDLITNTAAGTPGSRRVAVSADGPFEFLDGTGAVLATDVTRWEFDTNPDGTHHHVVKPLSFTLLKITYNILGESQVLTRTLEFI